MNLAFPKYLTALFLLHASVLAYAQPTVQASSSPKEIVLAALASASEGEVVPATSDSLAVSVLTESQFNTWKPASAESTYSTGQRFRIKVSAQRDGTLVFFNTNPKGETSPTPLLTMQLTQGVESVSEVFEITGKAGVDQLHLVLLPANNSASPYAVFSAMQAAATQSKDIRLATAESEATTYLHNPGGQGAFLTLKFDHSLKAAASSKSVALIAPTEKFLVPAIANYAGMAVFQALNTWVSSRLTPRVGDERRPSFTEILLPIGIELANTAFTEISGQIQNSLATSVGANAAQWAAVDRTLTSPVANQRIGFFETAPSAKSVIVLGQPDIPLNTAAKSFSPKAPWSDQSNYQGISASLIFFDDSGQISKQLPLSGKFPTSGKFKLQLVSTFDAVVFIDHLRTTAPVSAASLLGRNPPRFEAQLYPNQKGKAVQIKAGETISLPLGQSEFFSTAGGKPEDLLALHVMSSGNYSSAGQAGSKPIYRVDTNTETLFTQGSATNGTFGVSQLFSVN